MAQIIIGEGLWETIYGYLNSMFTELYGAVDNLDDRVTINDAKVSNANHSGDATGSTALTLATVNSNVGTFSNPTMTVNAKGLVTAIANGATGTVSKYTSGAFNLAAGEETLKLTTVPIASVIYGFCLLDSSGNNITGQILSITNDTTYKLVTIYSSEALTDCTLQILY